MASRWLTDSLVSTSMRAFGFRPPSSVRTRSGIQRARRDLDPGVTFVARVRVDLEFSPPLRLEQPDDAVVLELLPDRPDKNGHQGLQRSVCGERTNGLADPLQKEREMLAWTACPVPLRAAASCCPHDRSLPSRLPPPAGRPHARLVHAPGRPLHGRLPGVARAATRSSSSAGRPSWPPQSPCSRSTPSTSTPPSSSRTCCCRFEPMGLAFDFVKGEGPRDRAARSAPKPTSNGSGCSSRAKALGYVLEAIRHDAARARRPRPAHRLRRRAVHAGVLRHRGRAVARLRPHQGADVRRPRGVAPALRRGWPRWSAPSSSRRSKPAPRRSRSSTRGSARCRPRDYREFALPAHRRGLRRARSRPASRRSTSAPARRRSCADLRRRRRRRHRRRLAHCRSTTPGSSSAPTAPSRATSIRRSCSARATACSRAAEDVLQRAAGRPGHIFNLGHGILPATPLEHVQVLARFVHGFRAN